MQWKGHPVRKMYPAIFDPHLLGHAFDYLLKHEDCPLLLSRLRHMASLLPRETQFENELGILNCLFWLAKQDRNCFDNDMQYMTRHYYEQVRIKREIAAELESFIVRVETGGSRAMPDRFARSLTARVLATYEEAQVEQWDSMTLRMFMERYVATFVRILEIGRSDVRALRDVERRLCKELRSNKPHPSFDDIRPSDAELEGKPLELGAWATEAISKLQMGSGPDET